MPRGGKREGSGGKSATVALALDVADDLALIVQQLEDGRRQMWAQIRAADGEMMRAFRAAELLDAHGIAVLHSYVAALRETPSTTPTRGRVIALVEARTTKAALAARTANAA